MSSVQRHHATININHHTKAALLESFRQLCSVIPNNANLKDQLVRDLRGPGTNKDLVHVAQAREPDWFSIDFLLPPLSQEWQEAMNNSFASPRITYINLPNINESSLRRLQPGTMINDEIVEGYLSLLRGFGIPIATSHFFKLFPDRKITYESLSHHGQLLIPVHHAGILHWSFFHLQMIEGTVMCSHYDSYYAVDTNQFLRVFLFHFGRRVRNWKFRLVSSPRQTNGVDCGLFVLMGIRLLVSGATHLSQADADLLIPGFRHRVLAELLAGCLDPSPVDYLDYAVREMLAQQEFQPVYPGVIDCGSGIGYWNDPIKLDSPTSQNGHDSHQTVPFQSIASTEPESDGSLHARTFGTESSMLHTLRKAVSAYRTGNRLLRIDEMGENYFKQIWSRVCNETTECQFTRRYHHQMLYLEVSPELGSPSAVKTCRSNFEPIGPKSPKEEWKSFLNVVKRAAFWQTLDELCQTHGVLEHTALIACHASTSSHERLSAIEQKKFFHILSARLNDCQDPLLSNLRAAGPLCKAIVARAVPEFILLDRWLDLNLISFSAAVSMEAKVLLPGL